MITIFQGNSLSIPIEILNPDETPKDLTNFKVMAGIKKPDGTIIKRDCNIEGVGLVSLPLTETDTQQVGIYVVEIRLENGTYKETWGIFGIEVQESIIMKGV